MVSKNKIFDWFKNNIKFSAFDIALMGMMLSLYFIVVFILKQLLPGKLNINIEILFYIIFGIVFGPIKGPIFSFLSDTTYQIFLGGIVFWMYEYAIIPPLVSLFSWTLMFFYGKQNKFRFVFPIVTLSLTIIGIICFFIYELLNNSFKFEHSIVNSNLVFGLMITLCVMLITSIITTLILYKIKNKEIYIKTLYLIATVSIILIVFRWLWGPFAYIMFFIRFLSTDTNISEIMATQYPIALMGIAMKTTYILPIFVVVLVPTINAISINKKNYFLKRNYE